MTHFALFAHGAAFDVDRYLAATTLHFDEVWRAGQRHYATNGVRAVLGDGHSIPLPEQERMAIAYLEAHCGALRQLAQQPGVTTFVLGLQYHVAESGLLGFCLSFSPRLLMLALEVGVEPAFYVTIEPRRGGDAEGSAPAPDH